MANYIKGKVIIITGASAGFGKVLAKKTAAMGAKVVCAARRKEKIEELVESISANGGIASAVQTDISNKEDVQNLIDFTVKTYGCVDVLVNNAGVMPLAFLESHEKAIDKWEQAIDINIKGTLYGMAYAYDQMIKQGRGQIVNISSTYANSALAGAAVYGMTKRAIITMTDAFRQECKGKIKFSIVRPTGIGDTELKKGIIDPTASKAMFGHAFDKFTSIRQEFANGTADPGYKDIDSIKYLALDVDSMVNGIIYVIDQPWGVSVSDITVRASGEYLMY